MGRRLLRRALFAGLWIAALGALGIGAFTLHASRVAALQQVPPPEKYPWALRTAPVVKRELTAGFPVLATVRAEAEIVIMPQISGVIREMGPREGEAVHKGELLVRIDTREIAEQLAALEADLEAAREEAALRERDLRRREAVFKKGFATEEEIDRLRTAFHTAMQRVRQLENEIDALRTRLSYGVIRAPVDGIVSARLQEPGDLATPGHPIYRITASTGAKVRITVPQAVAERLHAGSELRLIRGRKSMSIPISRVFPSLDTLSMGTAEADLDSIPFGLPSGARVPGRVILDRWPDALIVPRTALALASDGASATIFRIVSSGDGTAKLQRVEVSIIGSGREGVAIEGAVREGDRVALAQESVLLKLKDGDPVLPETEIGQ